MAASLKDVAAKAGVSVMTASRCVRRQPGVAPATQAKVEAAIEALNYQQHPFVSALMRQVRSSGKQVPAANLAFLFFGPSEKAAWSRVVVKESFEGAKETAAANGFSLSSIWANSSGMTGTRLAQLLHARGCEGFLLSPPEDCNALSLFESFDWTRFSAVAIGQSTTLPSIPRVATDQHHLMQTLLRHLRALGYRRIGLALSGEADQRVDGHWLAAYLRHQLRHEGSLTIPVYYDVNDREGPELPIESWASNHQLDCLIQDRFRGSPLGQIKRRGESVIPQIALYHPRIECPDGRVIRRDFQGIGRAAVRMLLSELILNARGLPDSPVTQLIEAKLS